MKFKKFDASNTASARKGISTISFGMKGAIVLSGTACTAIGLKVGDTVALIQDEENPQDWFLTPDKNGFALRSNGPEGKGLAFNSAALASSVRECMDWSDDKAPVCRLITNKIAEKEMELFPIILSSAKKPEF